MPTSYRLPDEPAPSELSKFTVDPIYPFLALMIIGVWLALPWFIFNAYAVGSPTRKQETVIAALGLAAIGITVQAVLMLFGSGDYLSYALISVLVVKVAIGYAVYLKQSRSIEVYRYYGGEVGNGFLVIIVAFFINAQIPWELLSLTLRLTL